MRVRQVALALVVAMLAMALVPQGAVSTHDTSWCARTLDTIPIGTGNLGIDIDELEGTNHFDLPYPGCSDGRFFTDHSTEGVLHEQHCSEGFLRVYAPAGALGREFIINWIASGPGGCA